MRAMAKLFTCTFDQLKAGGLVTDKVFQSYHSAKSKMETIKNSASESSKSFRVTETYEGKRNIFKPHEELALSIFAFDTYMGKAAKWGFKEWTVPARMIEKGKEFWLKPVLEEEPVEEEV